MRSLRLPTPLAKNVRQGPTSRGQTPTGLATLVFPFLVAAVACNKVAHENTHPLPAQTPVGAADHLSWHQEATESEIRRLKFAVYVDGSRTELGDVSCEMNARGYTCTSALPFLAPGSHSLELVALRDDITPAVESPRSLPLRVQL